MKIVDQKGKLFGLINIIDLAILLAVAVLVTGIIIKTGSTEKETGKVSKEFIATVICRNVEGKVAENLKPGDQVVYGNVYVNGYIVSAEKFPAKQTVVLDDGTVKEVIVPNLSDVIVEMKILYDGTDNLIMLGKYQVNIGKGLTVKTNRVEVLGVVLDIVQK